MRRSLLLAAVWGAALLPLRAEDLTLSSLNPNPQADHLAVGLHIKAPRLGELVLEFPQIVPEGPGSWEHPLQAQLQSDALSTSVVYPCGARFTYALQPDGSVLCTYSGVPPTAQALWFPMMIPVSFQNGGRYAFGSPAPLKPFPASPAGRSVEVSTSDAFFLADASGAGFSLHSSFDRQGITDFRPAWNAFSWTCSYLLKTHPGGGSFVLHLAPFAAPPPS